MHILADTCVSISILFPNFHDISTWCVRILILLYVTSVVRAHNSLSHITWWHWFSTAFPISFPFTQISRVIFSMSGRGWFLQSILMNQDSNFKWMGLCCKVEIGNRSNYTCTGLLYLHVPVPLHVLNYFQFLWRRYSYTLLNKDGPIL